MVMFFLYILLVVFSLIPVAFFTLMERRILGNFHIRCGPMMVGYMGLFQPFSDAIKLFSSVDLLIRFSYFFYWLISPIFLLVLYFFILVTFPLGGGEVFVNFMFLLFICFLSFSIYFVLYGGYHSGSKYSLIGSYRSIAQMISYEVILIFMFVMYFYLVGSWNLSFKFYEYDGFGLFFCIVFVFVWFLVMLAEMNRLPYDFLEGESELVSGFNTEYWGGFFSFLFIFEYGSILFYSIISSYFLFSGVFSLLFFFFIMYFFLWIRVSVPRFRYDFLMNLAWSKIFFLIIGIMLFFVVV